MIDPGSWLLSCFGLAHKMNPEVDCGICYGAIGDASACRCMQCMCRFHRGCMQRWMYRDVRRQNPQLPMSFTCPYCSSVIREPLYLSSVAIIFAIYMVKLFYVSILIIELSAVVCGYWYICMSIESMSGTFNTILMIIFRGYLCAIGFLHLLSYRPLIVG